MDSPWPARPALPPLRGAAPRSVAQLAFPEILVIWTLRRYAGCRLPRDARAAAVAPELSRAFGLARLEDSLTALARLADSLAGAARLPQALSVLEDDRINATEEALLATLAALQHGETAQAAALSEWSLLPSGRSGFLAAATCLAQTMREAGHLIPYRAPPRRSLALAVDATDDRPLPSAGRAAELRDAERGLVAALRLWVEAFKRQDDPLGSVRAHFATQFNSSGRLWGDRRSGSDAGLGLHALLRNTTLAASRQVDVRCPACRGLSPDEARLVHAVAWLQRDLAEPAETALGDWLPPAAVRLSIASARGLAHALLAAEQALPLRQWDFAALTAAAEPAMAGAGTGAAGSAATRRSAIPTLH